MYMSAVRVNEIESVPMFAGDTVTPVDSICPGMALRRLPLLSPVRVRFDYRVVRPADAATVAEGHTVHASLDRTGRPARLPERARKVFQG